MEFRAGDPVTVGLELELQLLDTETLDLVDGVLPLIELYPDNPYIKPESIQNTVELITPVCRSVSEMHAHLLPLARDVRERCARLGMTLCGAGTHPFSRKLALATPDPRYQAMQQRAGYLMHSQITFATHVHLGMRDGDQAVAVMHRLKPFLPLLIALSASSPYWHGYDTHCVSYRHRVLAMSRSYGVPPSFDDWAAFCRFFETTRRARLFESVNDIHWDIRPRPRLGTLEVRAMDAQPTVAEAMALAALVRAVVWTLRTRPDTPGLPQPLPWWIEKENHYQASLRGLDAALICTAEGNHRSLAAVWQDVLAAVQPAAAELGEAGYLEALRRTVASGASHVRQRASFRARQSHRAVAADLAGELRRECETRPTAPLLPA
jgi:carboxylate-amine ligase